MANQATDLSGTIGNALGKIAREATQNLTSNGHKASWPSFRNGSSNGLSGARGVAAGAALATAVPLAVKGASKAVKGATNAVKGAKDTAKEGVSDAVGKKVDEAGGASGVAKEAGKKLLPGGGGDEKSASKKGTPGVGKGRRMPIQQGVDVAVPLETAYNQWTQFEEWPQFMHRLDRVTQEDDCTVSFRTKVWGISKEFVGEIVEQRPDERIQWTVTQGVTHTGVVSFHELAPRLTRIEVSLDVEPGSLIEKAARGMRHVKRAVRADLARFKAFIEIQEVETGAWRGVIHDGELVEEHKDSYDKKRDYAEFDDIYDTEHSHTPPGNGSGSSRAGSNRSSGSKRSSSSRRSSGGSSSSGRRRSSGGSSSRSKASSRGKASSKSSGSRSRSGSSRSQSGGTTRKRSGSRS